MSSLVIRVMTHVMIFHIDQKVFGLAEVRRI